MKQWIQSSCEKKAELFLLFYGTDRRSDGEDDERGLVPSLTSRFLLWMDL